MRTLILCLTTFIIVAVGRAENDKQFELFAKAIQNRSTAPNYVLVTIVNDNTKEVRQGCVLAPFLLGALHDEQQIPYDAASIRKVEELALSNKEKIFHFKNGIALNNVRATYTPEILDEMRTALKSYSEKELRDGFNGSETALMNLYMSKPGKLYLAYRDTIACVLLERGLLPRCGCVVGTLSIDN